MGVTPNLILILFFLLVFFEKPDIYYTGIFAAIAAGLFLDILSVSYFGISIISLLFVTFFIKKFLYLLKEKKDRYPIIYFIPLFIISLIIYNLFLAVSMYFFGSNPMFNLSWYFLVEIVYNLIFAILGFYIYKKLKLY
jgi:rod shape-determining protein MreD